MFETKIGMRPAGMASPGMRPQGGLPAGSGMPPGMPVVVQQQNQPVVVQQQNQPPVVQYQPPVVQSPVVSAQSASLALCLSPLSLRPAAVYTCSFSLHMLFCLVCYSKAGKHVSTQRQ